ncbi:MAG: helix-turn-helix transcriptional regulator, partial [Clostridia bacterium]
ISSYESYKLYIAGAENSDDNLLNWVKKYINRNFSSVSISTGEIAGLAHISEAHLCRMFKQHEGITLTEYLINRRIAEAKQLLLNDNLLMKDVALRSGYVNEKYFYSVFKKQVGVSPSQYKQQLKMEGEK